MSIFKMPISVQAEIEKVMRDFFWENAEEGQSRHLIAWETTCSPKDLGGLGIGNLDKRNIALLSKWLWRFPLEKEALWHRVIKAKYALLQNNWDPAGFGDSTYRNLWRSIQVAAEQFYQRTKWVVGRGNYVRFWEDSWCSTIPLVELFPALYRISNFCNRTISFFFDNQNREIYEDVAWNLHLSRNLTTREIEEASSLSQVLLGVRMKAELDDRRAWLDDRVFQLNQCCSHYLLKVSLKNL